MIKVLLILLFFIIGFQIHAQDLWSLRKCVDYGIENNLNLNQSVNQIESQKLNYLESQASLLPNLNAHTDCYLNFGRNIDGNTNEVTFDQTLRNSFGIDASVTLFQGLIRYNNMAFNRYLLAAYKENTEMERNKLVFNVLTAYYTVLYSNGLTQVAENQMALSELQYTRMLKLVEVGRESQITAQELKSQWANDKLSLTQTQNNANSKLLDLKQLLRITATNNFEIDTLNTTSLVIKPLPSIDSVFNQAKNILPNIKYQEYMLTASEKNLAVARGYISPRLYVAAGYYTNYYDANREGEGTEAFGKQLNENQSQQVAMGLIIPLFNGANTYSSIKRKQIAVLDQNLELEKQKDNLYAEIWNALNELHSSINEYESAIELLDYSKLTFDNAAKKLEKGLASTTEFEAAKQRYVAAEAGVLKAKLIYVMRNQMLEFYLSGNWSHL